MDDFAYNANLFNQCCSFPLTVSNSHPLLKEKSCIMKTIAAEYVVLEEPGNEDSWRCVCGNHHNAQGFFPCDKEGNQREPDKGWENLYVCDNCGRIIDQFSLRVVGCSPNFKRFE
jgi:hypothetical protein